MPHNKKHHYVPRFYLKRFSYNGRSISLWNINKKLKVLSANLQHQCYKNYFYGSELEAEKALGLIESHCARILRLIDEFQYPPQHGTEDYHILILYILTQHGRTVYAADLLNEMNEQMVKYILGPKANAEGLDLSKVNIGLKEPAKYSLGLSTELFPFLLDLNCKLILNETHVEFVTSDNPVVFYNQLFSFRRYWSNTGYASKGLQIFFPINPHMTIILYDNQSYSVGKRNNQIVKVTLTKDVYELNTLQMTSANENVYFRDQQLDIETLNKRSSAFRRNQKSNMDVFKKEKTQETREEIIASSRVDIKTNLKLSFVRITKATKIWRKEFLKQKNQPVAVVRNKQLCDDHREFMKKVDEGVLNHKDFLKFIAKNYNKS